jgi:hypothetical protein
MKRGIRPIWRELAEAAQKVADSKNYAEEYIYAAEFFRALERLERSGRWTRV